MELDFTIAVDAVIQEFGREGLAVDVEIRNTSFARLSVASGSDRSKVETGVDWRQHSPVQLAIGPVLDADDAVANKVCALFGRAEVRDYIDVDAVLTSGRYTQDDLLALAATHDAGFDSLWFAEALAAVDRLPVRLFQPYGVTSELASALKDRMIQWAHEIRSANGTDGDPGG